jgi:inorganic pyrophosphatase
MVEASNFWTDLDALVAGHGYVVERPMNSRHHRSPQSIYPLDYGYLEGTRTNDGAAVDVWFGSLDHRRIVGVVCTVDRVKNDVETKLLLGCSDADIEAIRQFFRGMNVGCSVFTRDSET